jgi:hypothetical protein
MYAAAAAAYGAYPIYGSHQQQVSWVNCTTKQHGNQYLSC